MCCGPIESVSESECGMWHVIESNATYCDELCRVLGLVLQHRPRRAQIGVDDERIEVPMRAPSFGESRCHHATPAVQHSTHRSIVCIVMMSVKGAEAFGGNKVSVSASADWMVRG